MEKRDDREQEEYLKRYLQTKHYKTNIIARVKEYFLAIIKRNKK